jgi:hypothetical protein
LKTQRLTALDATFLNFETARQPLHIGGLYIYEDQPTIAGRPGVRGLFQTLEERLHLVPRYRQRIREVPLALGHPLGSMIPTSTSRITCDGLPCPALGA